MIPHCRYPVMHAANAHGNGRETVACRREATTNARNRDLAWEDLASLEGTKQIPAEWRKTFRQALTNIGLLQLELACTHVCLQTPQKHKPEHASGIATLTSISQLMVVIDDHQSMVVRNHHNHAMK